MVDRFDLRRHMRFDAGITSAAFDEPSGTWTVTLGDGGEVRARFLIAATGVLSVPYTPDVPGREDFRGEAHHTGRWPATPVDFARKRVAVVGTSSSGVQVVPTILDEVETLAVYQRTANWCTPLNNTPITPEEQAQLRAEFEDLCQVLNTSISGFAHPVNERAAFDDSEAARRAFYETMWNSPGFMKLTSNYGDLLLNEAANDEWGAFIGHKIRGIVHGPETAERLIPKDHRFGEKRPPFVTGYFEAFNEPKVSLVDLRETPIVGMTETGIETTDGVREFDIVVWATGFDFGTGALSRMGIRGRNGLELTEHWADGPTTFLGLPIVPQTLVCQLIGLGVPERFPDLHVSLIEFNAHWLSSLVGSMDKCWVTGMGQDADWWIGVWDDTRPDDDQPNMAQLFRLNEKWPYPLMPSEYVKRQFHVSFQDDPVAVTCRHLTGLSTIVWGNDYPHVGGRQRRRPGLRHPGRPPRLVGHLHGPLASELAAPPRRRPAAG